MKITRFEAFCERCIPYFIGFLLLVILLVMGGCNNRSVNEALKDRFQTIEIEGCEYLVADLMTSSAVITHKGNCKNHKPCE